MIDTHTHLYLSEFAPQTSEPSPQAPGCPASAVGEGAVDRALAAGVTAMVLPNVDLSTIASMRALHAARPGVTFMAMGLHPTEIREDWRGQLDQVEKELRSHLADYVAVGEVGIDLYWDATFRKEQMEAFATQLRWAAELKLPVIIHCREGLSETLEVLQGMEGPLPTLVFHSFTGSSEDVRRIRTVAPEAMFGINGVVTFKNSRVGDSLAEIGLDNILLETDSPYLAPVPHRGRRNESAYLPHVAAYVADRLGTTIGEVDRITTLNSLRTFPLITQNNTNL